MCVSFMRTLLQVRRKASCMETARRSRCKHRCTNSTVGLKAGWCEAACVCMSMFFGRMHFALVPLFPRPLLLLPPSLVPLSHFLSPPIILILHWRAVSEPWMHYAVCSIVCAVSLRLCPTLSQYLFSLITMGACCGCLDGFFGRLLFRSAAFVFRHWLSVFLFVCLCVCAHAYMPTCNCVVKDRGGREKDVTHISLSSHRVMYPSCLHLFILSRLITAVLE